MAMQPVIDMVALLDEVGMPAVRAKSVLLTEFAVEAARELLPGVLIASPLEPERRGSHITLAHPRFVDVYTRLWDRDVIPDFRRPDNLRVGLSPLSTSFTELARGLVAVAEELRVVGGAD
ncbi:hypothetical protein GCM10029964_073140 [Kibdelosporangium lantanae]